MQIIFLKGLPQLGFLRLIKMTDIMKHFKLYSLYVDLKQYILFVLIAGGTVV